DPQPTLTLADAMRVSSNIAMAKFVTRLATAEQYLTLRAFGFGANTGIEFPAEAPGRLRLPSEWTRPSAASLAMGYELSVTPIQVAAAVTGSMLEQARAARTVALDRTRLSLAAPRAAAAPLEDDGGLVPYVVPWPYQPDSAAPGPRGTVPDVTGLGMREAVRTLH